MIIYSTENDNTLTNNFSTDTDTITLTCKRQMARPFKEPQAERSQTMSVRSVSNTKRPLSIPAAELCPLTRFRIEMTRLNYVSIFGVSLLW